MSNHMKISGGAAGGGRSAGGLGMLKTFKRVFTTTAANLQHRKPRALSLPPPPPPNAPVSSSSTTTTAVSGHTLRKASALNASPSSVSPLDVLTLPSPESSASPLLSGDSVAFCGEDLDWVAVDSSDGDVLIDDALSVGEVDKVQHAFSALQLVLDVDTNPDEEDGILQPVDAISGSGLSTRSEVDWIEPPLQLCNAGVLQLQPCLYDRLFDAFHLLQTEPSIQRMVVSLASDKAVWDAVMSNEVVRELITDVECDTESSGESAEDSGSAADIVKRLFESSKARIIDVIERITKYVTDLFKIPTDEKAKPGLADAAPAVEKLQTVVLLSVIVLLIVVVNRATRA